MIITQNLDIKDIDRILWQSFIPDITPIEPAWDEVQRWIDVHQNQLQNVSDLAESLAAERRPYTRHDSGGLSHSCTTVSDVILLQMVVISLMKVTQLIFLICTQF